jgi:hypothetical protein
MAEPTEQQLDQAAAAYGITYGGDAEGPSDARREGLRAAAPFLQLPWEPPTEEEVASLYGHVGIIRIHDGIREFVRHRNDAIQPKPVYPRREALIGFLKTDSWKDMRWTELADRILAAIDAAK